MADDPAGAQHRKYVDIRERHLCLGEGEDEVQTFSALARHMGISTIQVMSYGGKDQLSSFLTALVLRPEFRGVRGLLVTRDADSSAAGAWQSVAHALCAATLPIPKKISEWTTVSSSPHVCVAILPGEGQSGALEDLCLRAWESDSAMPCVDNYLTCLEGAGLAHDPNLRAKARLHAFLASRAQPDLRLGHAAQKHQVPFDAPAFEALRRLLGELVDK